MKYLTLLTLLFVTGCEGRLRIESTPLEDMQPEGSITIIEGEDVSYEYPKYYVTVFNGGYPRKFGPYKSWRISSPGGHMLIMTDKQKNESVFCGEFYMERE